MIRNHLNVRSDFSLGESTLQMSALVKRAKELNYESVTLMDTMSVHGLVDFSVRAEKEGIKPNIGCRLRVVEDPTYRKPAKSSGEVEKPNPLFMPKVYALNEEGVQSIFALLTKATSPEYFYYHSRVGLDDVAAMKGVAFSTGDFFNLFHMADYEAKLEKLIAALGKEDVYIELMPANTPLFDTLNAKAMQMAVKYDLPTLATYPACYAEEGDALTLEVLWAITNNTQWDAGWRPQQYLKDLYLAEPERMDTMVREAYERQVKWYGIDEKARWCDAITNANRLDDRMTFKYKKLEVSLPTMATNEFVELGRKCIEGWKKRFSKPVLGHMPAPADLPVYRARLEYELGILKRMGFAGYFLMTEDLVNHAKSKGIIVGPGRGSVGGSLIAYLIGITEVGPIRFDLLFERFINPDRLDLPDADLDFMSSRRHEVVDYLRDRYGAARVAGISNYSTLGAASALRDTGRIFGLSGIDMAATKLVPKEHGISYTLEEAAAAVPEIDKFRMDQPEVWKHALKLEGAMRAFGQHAAGIVVAGEDIVKRAVYETRGDTPVVNWDKRVVEDLGLVKMDLLGLSTLDTLAIAAEYIKEHHGVTVDYTAIPLDDPKVLDAFGAGETTGVFQFESGGMRKLLRDLATGGRLTFEDVAAATALYRPGPMDSGMMDDFVAIKKGLVAPHYDHPNMEQALENTQGVIIYQEQVMRVAVDLAGFTFTEADHLRKAMGKKDKDKMAKMKGQFVDGAEKHSGMPAAQASELFDKIAAFAGYGFNKSHAVEYTVISVWTMWLRVNYPAEYFAACMSIVAEDKLPGLVKDAREVGIEVLPPDINLSSHKFEIPDPKHLLAPFSSVKGISENTAKRIVELREAQPGGKWLTDEEFKATAKTKGSKVNVRVVENLELVGALANITAGAKPPRDISRRRDQVTLMGALIVDAVKADRQTDVKDPFLRTRIIEIVRDYRNCTGCDLQCQNHPAIRMKNTVKFMVVSDCPNWEEEKKDKLLEGAVGKEIKDALEKAGLAVGDGYYTTLVKAKKNDKFLTNAQISACKPFLDREIEAIKPPIIVALGSAAIKHFIPGTKGSTAGLVGTSTFNTDLDANIVCGLNPAQILFNPDKADDLVKTFQAVAEILS